MVRKPRVMSPDEAATALDAAEATLARWSGEAARLAVSAETLAGDLAAAQARAADDLLDADDADDDAAAVARVAGDLLRRQTEQGLAVQAAQRAAERLTEVRRDVLRTGAAATRTRAAGLRDMAAARRAHTEQLLAGLADFEQVRYEVAARDNFGMSAAIRPKSRTEQIEGRARWLDGHADHLERIAATGGPDQVLSLAGTPLPEVLDVEIAATPAVVA